MSHFKNPFKPLCFLAWQDMAIFFVPPYYYTGVKTEDGALSRPIFYARKTPCVLLPPAALQAFSGRSIYLSPSQLLPPISPRCAWSAALHNDHVPLTLIVPFTNTNIHTPNTSQITLIYSIISNQMHPNKNIIIFFCNTYSNP